MSRRRGVTEKGDTKRDLYGRGRWLLEMVNDTPVPGHYHLTSFLEEADLNPVRRTYGFKGPGRDAQTRVVRQGELLLPGAYDHRDSTQEILKRRASYSFKSCPRPDPLTLGVRDKDLKTSPCDYNVTEKTAGKTPCTHAAFRSAVQRISFPPREGPGPSDYVPRAAVAGGITSCFKSTLPRLHSVASRTPGPGAYTPPQLDHPLYMGARGDLGHCLFFRGVSPLDCISQTHRHAPPVSYAVRRSRHDPST